MLPRYDLVNPCCDAEGDGHKDDVTSEAAMSEITSGTALSRILKTRGVASEAKGASWHQTIKLLVSHVKEACVDDSTLLSWWRDHTELSQRAYDVELGPLFLYPAVGDPKDLVSAYRHVLASWGGPQSRCPASLVGSAKCVAAHHLVPFGDHVLNVEMAIGEGREERDGDVIVFLLVQRTRTAWKVTSVGGGEEILSDDPFPLIQELVEIPTGDSLVCFC